MKRFTRRELKELAEGMGLIERFLFVNGMWALFALAVMAIVIALVLS